MGIFRKRKRKIKTKIIELRMPVLVRQVIYDSIFDDTEAIANSMGLPPISQEVAEMEQSASEERIAKFSPLLPFIESHSDIAARVAAAAYQLEMLEDHPDESPLIEEDLEHIVNLFKLVSLSSAVSCVSTLMNLDLLETSVKLEDNND